MLFVAVILGKSKMRQEKIFSFVTFTRNSHWLPENSALQYRLGFIISLLWVNIPGEIGFDNLLCLTSHPNQYEILREKYTTQLEWKVAQCNPYNIAQASLPIDFHLPQETFLIQKLYFDMEITCSELFGVGYILKALAEEMGKSKEKNHCSKEITIQWFMSNKYTSQYEQASHVLDSFADEICP